VRTLPRLVVLDDPARAERIDVDPVDLPGEPEIVRERKAALELRCGPLGAEGNLEAAGYELHLGRCLVSQEALEVGARRLPQLGGLEIGQVESDSGFESIVEAATHELDR